MYFFKLFKKYIKSNIENQDETEFDLGGQLLVLNWNLKPTAY